MDHRARFARAYLAVGLLTVIAFFASVLPTAAAVTIGSPTLVGTNSNSSLREISGLVASRSVSNVLWVHNDSGDSARFFAMSTQGQLLGTFPLAGATARDWEDIAIGPKSDGGNYLYLGDIGDNDAVRSTITVQRVVEPPSTSGATIPVGSYASLNLQYPSGARDVESMFVDPLSGDMYFITKRRLVPEVYSVPTSAFDTASGTVTMTALGNFSTLPLFATAADISPDGRFILVRSSTSSNGRLFERKAGQTVSDALHTAGISFALGAESQGEAIGWAADGTSFFTTSEMDGASSAPIYSYAFSAPLPLLAGDYNNDQRVDASDYTVWCDQLGVSVALPNETDTPGMVTAEDYDVWRAHFGETLGGASLGAAIPEPTSGLLTLLAFTSLAGASRHRVAYLQN